MLVSFFITPVNQAAPLPEAQLLILSNDEFHKISEKVKAKSGKIDNKQIVLGYVERSKVSKGQKIGAYYLARSQSQKTKGKKECVAIGEKLDSEICGVVLSRFEKF